MRKYTTRVTYLIVRSYLNGQMQREVSFTIPEASNIYGYLSTKIPPRMAMEGLPFLPVEGVEMLDERGKYIWRFQENPKFWLEYSISEKDIYSPYERDPRASRDQV